MNLYGFAGGDPVNFSDPFGLWPCPELCAAAGAGGGSIALGSGAISLPSVGAAAAAVGAAVPAIALGAIGGVLLRPAFPGAAAPARAIPGALVGTDATAVGLPTTMEMGKLGSKIRSLLTGILIGVGDGMDEQQQKERDNRQREEQLQEEKSKPQGGAPGPKKPDTP